MIDYGIGQFSRKTELAARGCTVPEKCGQFSIPGAVWHDFFDASWRIFHLRELGASGDSENSREASNHPKGDMRIAIADEQCPGFMRKGACLWR